MIPFVILKSICFNRPLAVLVRDAENTEGDLFFLVGRPQRNKLRIPQGRRRSGKNLSPPALRGRSGNFCPPQVD